MFGNFCPGCGNIAPAGHEFCRHCGRHLNDSSTEVADGNGSRAAAATTTTAAIAEPVTLPHTDSITGAAPMMTDIGATADDGAPGSRRRRWVFFGVGGGAAVIIAAVGGWLLFGRDDSPQRTRRALAPVPGAVAAPLRSAATAKRLVEIQLAGRLASKAVERITIQSGAAQGIDDPRHRAVAAQTLRAERALAADLGHLSTMKEQTLPQWPALKQRLEQDTLTLREKRTAVAELDVPGGVRLVISPRSAERAIATVDGVLQHADASLRQWRSQTRRQRARNRRSLSALTSYATTVRGHLRSYDRLRDETSNWVAKVDSDGATFSEAYQVLGDMADSRQNIKDAISAIDAPPALSAAQDRLVLVLGNAVQGMHDATSGIGDYQFNQDQYDFNYKKSPGWQQFERMSSQVTSDYAAARRGWVRRVAERERSIRNRDLPPAPAV